MPVGGEPLVGRILTWLAASGVRDVILNLHHLAQSITRIVGTGDQYGVRVRYSWEDPILGSAGGPRRAFTLVESDELLVVNGDTVTDPDLASLVRQHRSSDALATLAVIPHPHAHRYGGVHADAEDRYRGPAGRGEGWHFVGVQVIRRAAFDELADGVPAATIGGVYEHLAKARPGSVRICRTAASFLDVGTPETYLEASLSLGRDVSMGERCQVAASSQLSRSVLWDDVEIEEDVTLSECIVCDRVTVPRASRYHRVVLLRPGDAPQGPLDRIEQGLHVAPLGAG
jgi:NDP-sugar pyrophosphorylase family protein